MQPLLEYCYIYLLYWSAMESVLLCICLLYWSACTKHGECTVVYMFVILKCYQAWRVYCCVYVCYIEVPVPSMESVLLCICLLYWSACTKHGECTVVYIFVILKCLHQAWRVYCCVYVCYIEVPVPSMESVLLCICLLYWSACTKHGECTVVYMFVILKCLYQAWRVYCCVYVCYIEVPVPSMESVLLCIYLLYWSACTKHGECTVVYIFVILKCLYQAWRVYCCVYVCYIEVPVPSMESVLLCICLLYWSACTKHGECTVVYMFVILKCLYQAWRLYCCVYVCYIEVPVPSMESVLLCICLLYWSACTKHGECTVVYMFVILKCLCMESVLLCIYLLYWSACTKHGECTVVYMFVILKCLYQAWRVYCCVYICYIEVPAPSMESVLLCIYLLYWSACTKHGECTVVYMFVILKCLHQAWRVYCCVYICYIEVPAPSMESVLLCICLLYWSACTKHGECTVVYMFVRGVDCFSIFAIFRLNFGMLCSKAIRDRKVIVCSFRRRQCESIGYSGLKTFD